MLSSCREMLGNQQEWVIINNPERFSKNSIEEAKSTPKLTIYANKNRKHFQEKEAQKETKSIPKKGIKLYTLENKNVKKNSSSLTNSPKKYKTLIDSSTQTVNNHFNSNGNGPSKYNLKMIQSVLYDKPSTSLLFLEENLSEKYPQSPKIVMENHSNQYQRDSIRQRKLSETRYKQTNQSSKCEESITNHNQNKFQNGRFFQNSLMKVQNYSHFQEKEEKMFLTLECKNTLSLYQIKPPLSPNNEGIKENAIKNRNLEVNTSQTINIIKNQKFIPETNLNVSFFSNFPSKNNQLTRFRRQTVISQYQNQRSQENQRSFTIEEIELWLKNNFEEENIL